jgi:hypothetical protein
MSPDEAAPCRHAGVPQPQIVESVSNLLQTLASHPELLEQHGLTAKEYSDALPMAIEAVRGRSSASNADRRRFITSVFESMREQGLIAGLVCPQYGADTVYRLTIAHFGDVAVIQKGCPDGAHSSRTWSTPDWAKETYLWWMCDSLKYHPGAHVAKGVNRLQARFFDSTPDRLDGVIFHNQLCGSIQRPCKKSGHSVTIQGKLVPPPCVYIMPDRDDGDSWNWQGAQARIFPGILLSLFNIPEDLTSSYLGYVGFQRRGNVMQTTISSRFGSARSTRYRS